MSKITLVQYPGVRPEGTASALCGKVRMALHAKALEFKVLNAHSPRQAKRFNPRGRVPTLILDGEIIVDSSDIVTALDVRFPARPLTPSDPMQNAQAKLYEDWADEVLYFYLGWLRWGVDANFARMREARMSRLPWPRRWILPPIARRIACRRFCAQGVGLKGEAVVRRELEECVDALDTLLDGRNFLVGERLTRADLAVAAVVDQMGEERLTPELADGLRRRRAIVAWLDRVHVKAPCAC